MPAPVETNAFSQLTAARHADDLSCGVERYLTALGPFAITVNCNVVVACGNRARALGSIRCHGQWACHSD
jgi:hypothetical protein